MLKGVPAGSPLGYGATFVTARDSMIATLPIGYEDGVRRGLSNRGRVIVRGQFAPMVGRISMDLTIVDVTGIAGVAEGDLVTVIGEQGGAAISAEEVAGQIDGLSYEVTCGIGTRVPRVYKCSRNAS
jgi:alanine racemase